MFRFHLQIQIAYKKYKSLTNKYINHTHINFTCSDENTINVLN